MLPSFEFMLKLIKIKSNSVSIDNGIFKLHYKFTAIILISCGTFLSVKQFVGNPISCIANDAVPEVMLNDFCWVNPTFTLPRKVHLRIGKELVAPGVLHHTNDDELQLHNYYQWVFLVLFLQAACFSFPRYIWKACEGDLMKSLSSEITFPTIDREMKEKRLCQLSECFLRHHFGKYVSRFLICEVLNLGNVLIQIWLLDTFMSGEFSKYGWKVLEFSETDDPYRADVISVVFPKLSKCIFFLYGPNGSVQKLDTLCLLPLNVINEKILIFSWIWFSLLALLTSLCLTYRVLTFFSKCIRHCVLGARSPITKRAVIKKLSQRLNFSDWFLLCQLGKNVYPGWFDELLILLAERIDLEDKLKKNSQQLDYKIEPVI